MKVLLDTNIIIHREASSPSVNQDIGILYKWLDRLKYTKCIHPYSVSEIEKNPNRSTVSAFRIKMQSYELLSTIAPLTQELETVSSLDKTENDQIDTALLNELYNDRVDMLITEDRNIQIKAAAIGISEKVLTINGFLERIASEHPELINYSVLNVRQKYFAEVDLTDQFFDSFREDYPGFAKWFRSKANEKVYVSLNPANGLLQSFLYLKTEGRDEVYSDIQPVFQPKKRVKIGTFKVVSNGVRLGERFLKIVFDNALANKADEIYVTIFDKRDEQKRLIDLLTNWGFVLWGSKSTGEQVYVRDFAKRFNALNPRLSYPYISRQCRFFLVPIYPEYHTELFPDSILRTESAVDFEEDEPYRNAINKVYVSRSLEKGLKKGDVLIFYRTGGIYRGVVTTLCIVEDVLLHFDSEEAFVQACRKRSVYSETELRQQWNYNVRNRPFVVAMLYNYSFPKRAILKELIANHVISDVNDVPRGFREISLEKFETILKLTNTNESFIVD